MTCSLAVLGDPHHPWQVFQKSHELCPQRQHAGQQVHPALFLVLLVPGCLNRSAHDARCMWARVRCMRVWVRPPPAPCSYCLYFQGMSAEWKVGRAEFPGTRHDIKTACA